MDLENKISSVITLSEMFNESKDISKNALIAYEFTQKGPYVPDERSFFTKFLYKYIL
jgi:hypothetical protein